MVTLSDFSGLIRAATRGKNGKSIVLGDFCKIQTGSAVQVEKAEKSRKCTHARILEIGENSVFCVCPLAAALG